MKSPIGEKKKNKRTNPPGHWVHILGMYWQQTFIVPVVGFCIFTFFLYAKWWNQDKWLQMVETTLQKTNQVYLVLCISTPQMFAWLAGPAETIQKGLPVKAGLEMQPAKIISIFPFKNIISPCSFSRTCDLDVIGAFAFIFLPVASVF